MADNNGTGGYHHHQTNGGGLFQLSPQLVRNAQLQQNQQLLQQGQAGQCNNNNNKIYGTLYSGPGAAGGTVASAAAATTMMESPYGHYGGAGGMLSSSTADTKQRPILESPVGGSGIYGINGANNGGFFTGGSGIDAGRGGGGSRVFDAFFRSKTFDQFCMLKIKKLHLKHTYYFFK